ncbi:MAG: SDR family NAD(P)-dependent oxidoreductase [Spirochaetes bacterium]|nr:SDR family NAD(P)-dependent oxidoreductase [Spirochaetota bacterium]
MKLAEKNIVITGASKGLGKEIALRLCRQNTNLILVARTRSLLEETQKEVEELSGKKAILIPCDISNEAEVNRMAEVTSKNFKHIDVLINNAGVGIHKNLSELSGDEMRKQFETNFFGPFYCIKALLPLLKLSNYAYILNVNSIASRIAFADNSVYAATKSALARFTEGLRQELKELSINVGSFFPGLMKTTFQEDRKNVNKIPPFMIIDPETAAAKIERMIIKSKKNAYILRLMTYIPMKIKQLAA